MGLSPREKVGAMRKNVTVFLALGAVAAVIALAYGCKGGGKARPGSSQSGPVAVAVAPVAASTAPAAVPGAAPAPVAAASGPSAAESTDPEEVQKRSLAVLDFTIHTSNDPKLHSEFSTNLLTDKLTSALAQTRKFRIVERQRIDSLLKEFKLSDQGFADKKFAVKAGEMVGADYILTGSVSAMTASAKTERVPYTNESVTTMNGRVAADMRIVDSRTGEIVSAWRADAASSKSGNVDRESFLDALQQDLAQKLVERVLEAVYPVKVAEVQADGTLYLNRGQGGGLKVGDTLDVFQPGKVIIDPDTKEAIGASEVKVGSAKVTEVRPRITIARITQGQIAAGAVARLASGKAGDSSGGSDGSAKPRVKLNW